MKTILHVIILLSTVSVAIGQKPIHGETADARVGTPYIYYWEFSTGDPVPSPIGDNMGGYSWYVTTSSGVRNAQWSTSTAVNASITFTAPGSAQVWVQWQGGIKQSLTVNVKDAGTAAPGASINIDRQCGYTRLQRVGEPPAGYEWWWQTASNGERLDLGKQDVLIVNSSVNPKTIFLRPRKATSPFTWGSSQNIGLISVATSSAGAPAAPPAPFNVFYNTYSTVSVTPVSGQDISYKWYFGDIGKQMNASNAITERFTRDIVLQVSSFNGCESAKTPVSVKIVPLPQITTANSNSPDVSGGRYVTLKTTANYSTYKWYSSAVAGVIATTPTINTNTPALYSVQVSKPDVSNGVQADSPYFPVSTSSQQNYVSTTEVQIPGVSDPVTGWNLSLDKRTENLAYFDGLGRPIQNVSRQASTSHNDVVQPVQYDEFGREDLKYPAYVHGEGNGWLKIDPTGKAVGGYSGTIHNQFYQNATAVAHDNKAFSVIEFDRSPLNREVKKYGPGESWYANNKYTETQYLSNVDGTASNTDQEKIVIWKIGSNNELVYQNTAQFYYPTNELYIKVTTDEQNHTVREYTNKQGQLVLKKVQVSNEVPSLNDLDNWASTYYVYDELNNLVMVIPPQAVKEILSTN